MSFNVQCSSLDNQVTQSATSAGKNWLQLDSTHYLQSDHANCCLKHYPFQIQALTVITIQVP